MTVTAQEARPNPAAARAGHVARGLVQLLVVAVLSLLFGAATSFAQTFLPDALRPLSNSASGWTLLTTVAVAACRASARVSALLGVASFVALVLGYQLMSTLRGFPTTETLFLVVGVIVGPFVGVAASWLRRSGIRAAAGCGILAGIAIGEGAWGLITVSASTGWIYWTLISIAGLALLTGTLTKSARTPRTRLPTISLTAAVTVAFFFSYTAAGTLTL